MVRLCKGLLLIPVAVGSGIRTAWIGGPMTAFGHRCANCRACDLGSLIGRKCIPRLPRPILLSLVWCVCIWKWVMVSRPLIGAGRGLQWLSTLLVVVLMLVLEVVVVSV